MPIYRLLLAATVAVATGISQLAIAASSELLTTANCKVVFNDPSIPVSTIATVSWTGDCRGGYIGGAGELILFLRADAKETFVGTAFRGSLLKGTYTKQDGSKFEGEFDPSSRRFSRGKRFSNTGQPIEEGLFDGLSPMVAGKSLMEDQQFEGTLFSLGLRTQGVRSRFAELKGSGLDS